MEKTDEMFSSAVHANPDLVHVTELQQRVS
jgi:hypothetical protein